MSTNRQHLNSAAKKDILSQLSCEADDGSCSQANSQLLGRIAGLLGRIAAREYISQQQSGMVGDAADLAENCHTTPEDDWDE